MTLLLKGHNTFVFHEKNQSGEEFRMQEMSVQKKWCEELELGTDNFNRDYFNISVFFG